MPKRYDNEIVLAFSDLHLPYQHKHALEFLSDINSDYKPDRILNLGDNLDLYSVSSYPKDIDHKDSWSKELKKARKGVEELAELFPDMEIMESNHCDRAYKKSRVAGIPREFMVPYRDIIGAPDSWKWHSYLTITVDSTRERLFFCHTKSGGALACAKDYNCSAFLGHSHSKFGMTGFKPQKKTIYGVDVGSLISDKGSPYKYNRGDRSRPIQGCCVIISGKPNMVEL